MASFIFTAENILYCSPKESLSCVEMQWLLIVSLCDGGGHMMRARKVARTHTLLPNSPTWHIDLSSHF